jgi:hypothetical protein
MHHKDFLNKGDRGEFMEEDLTGSARYSVTVERENKDLPDIRWELKLPKVTPARKESNTEIEAYKREYRPLPVALRECIGAFHVERQDGWTDKEYAMLKKKVASLLWDPPSEWLQRMHLEVAKMLGTEDYSALEIYPVNHTAADKYHGIDTFLQYKTPKGKKLMVTLDISERNKDDFKADILITETGARLNPEYYPITADSFFDIPDLAHASATEQRRIEQQRREKLAALIVKAFVQKEENLKKDPKDDGHYDFYPLEQSLFGENPEIRNRTTLHSMMREERRRARRAIDPSGSTSKKS